MKNTVIFDLDGLLIDSEIISFRLYEEPDRKIWTFHDAGRICNGL